MHLEFGVTDEEARPGEVLLVLFVIANDVTDVLAHEALDAFSKLLASFDVFLEHAVATLGHGRRHECGHLRRLHVVKGDVRDEVADDGDRDGTLG